jgi:AraC family transcriptional regulator of adaptative response/methylated-DNA-[protein]-cysteine methyltransferase
MSDYDRIAEAISFIASRVNSQPSLQEIARHLHLSPFHFQRLFSRWTGVTPKRFLQVLTLERAKQLLSESKPLLEVSDSLGLSSGSRLYDHFVHLEAVTPGEYKMGGAGLTIEYAVHDTPFGKAFIATTPRGICNFAFLDSMEIHEYLTDLYKEWPQAIVHENRKRTLAVIRAMFRGEKKSDRPVSLHVSGTNFQISVWKALLQIPPATVASYSQVATAIGHPKSARAVGLAVGANPVAFLIPCHRVIQQSGKLGGYHWGETRKQAIHAWESARYE